MLKLVLRSFSLMMVLTGLAWSQEAKVPRITFSAEGWDFGEREQGAIDKQVVVVKNEGNAPLIIAKIQVTCGCINGIRDRMDEALSPGEERELVFHLDTTRQKPGLVRKFCYVSSNDPERPNAILALNGSIIADWDVSSHNVNIGEIDAGTEAEASFRVEVRPGKKVLLKGIESRSETAWVTPESFVDEDGTHGWVIRIKLKPDAAPGPLTLAVGIKTDHLNTPYLNVMVHARINGHLRLRPARMFLGRVFEGEEKGGNVSLSRDDGQAFGVVKVESMDPRMTVSLATEGELAEHVATCSFKPRSGDRNVKGRIRFILADGDQKAIAVEWQAMVAPPIK
ncbi:MAG: DUF1573 domain-containing protein [Salinibacterium sp.]|nr:DUF1573 domain-containing protein [Salinibacterium sp.]